MRLPATHQQDCRHARRYFMLATSSKALAPPLKAGAGSARQSLPAKRLYALPHVVYSTQKKDVDAAELGRLLAAARASYMDGEAGLGPLPQFEHWRNDSGMERVHKLRRALSGSRNVIAAFANIEVCSSDDDAGCRDEITNGGSSQHEYIAPDAADRADVSWHWQLQLPSRAHRTKRLIGFARAAGDGALVSTVYDLAVHPQVQGLGLGQRMLKMLVQQVCGQAVYDIGTFVPVALSPFFSSCGFEADRLESECMFFRPARRPSTSSSSTLTAARNSTPLCKSPREPVATCKPAMYGSNVSSSSSSHVECSSRVSNELPFSGGTFQWPFPNPSHEGRCSSIREKSQQTSVSHRAFKDANTNSNDLRADQEWSASVWASRSCCDAGFDAIAAGQGSTAEQLVGFDDKSNNADSSRASNARVIAAGHSSSISTGKTRQRGMDAAEMHPAVGYVSGSSACLHDGSLDSFEGLSETQWENIAAFGGCGAASAAKSGSSSNVDFDFNDAGSHDNHTRVSGACTSSHSNTSAEQASLEGTSVDNLGGPLYGGQEADEAAWKAFNTPKLQKLLLAKLADAVGGR